MHVEQKKDEIYLHQKIYVDQILRKYSFQDADSSKTPIEKGLKLEKTDGCCRSKILHAILIKNRVIVVCKQSDLTRYSFCNRLCCTLCLKPNTDSTAFF